MRPLTRALMLAAALLAALAPLAAAGADSAVLFIGDGMGAAQIAMARGAAGGDPLAMERLPYSGLVTTHSASHRITDSAAAGTALATGRKTNNGMVSVLPDGARLETILQRALRAGKSVGVVTTDALTGGTPAPFLAHVADRGERAEIAAQLVQSGAHVMLGFWRADFLPEGAGGRRRDGRNLVAELRRRGYDVVFTRQELADSQNLAIVGLFDDGEHAPSLAEMTAAALARLSVNADGFLLVVEGARIDWACHGNDPAGSVIETWAFDEAVAAAAEFARQRGRTLVLVTADHETGGLRIEHPNRLPALRGVRGDSAAIASHLNADRTNVGATLAEHAGIRDITLAEADRVRAASTAAAGIAALLSERAGVSWTTTGHSAAPVPIYALGPGAERFTGQMDNTDVPSRIAQLLRLGEFPR